MSLWLPFSKKFRFIKAKTLLTHLEVQMENFIFTDILVNLGRTCGVEPDAILFKLFHRYFGKSKRNVILIILSFSIPREN